MPDSRQHVLVLVARPAWGRTGPDRAAGAGWRVEPVLADQRALDRAGSRGRTPPPFDVVLWRDLEPDEPLGDAVPDAVRAGSTRWAALRVRLHPGWDDTTPAGTRPEIKQVSLLKAQRDLTTEEFRRHFREHVAVARVHHPAIVRYAQHDVLETVGDPPLDVHGISELWFADEATLVERYFAGPDSVAVVRADNQEYIDFSGTLSLLVRPADANGAT